MAKLEKHVLLLLPSIMFLIYTVLVISDMQYSFRLLLGSLGTWDISSYYYDLDEIKNERKVECSPFLWTEM